MIKKYLAIGLILTNSILPIASYAISHFPKKPKNIIFMVGDGMGLTQIYAGMVANGMHLHLEKCKHIGLSKTYSADNLITDSAAGATAFSIGKKTYNGAIGVDRDSIAHETILERAAKEGLATGMVVTCPITHATPASFIAHQPSRSLDESIAADMLKTPVNVLIGGGQKFFDQRKDARNLSEEFKAKGYTVTSNMDSIMHYNGDKLIGFTALEDPKKVNEGRGNELEKTTEKALEILSKNKKGFFLLVEGSQIDWGGHSNETNYITSEMIDFDLAIGKVLAFAEKNKNTLVVITADHETGGFAINGGSIANRTIEGKFTTKKHTGVMVPIFAFGPGAEEFMGIMENTSIYTKMMCLFGFK